MYKNYHLRIYSISEILWTSHAVRTQRDAASLLVDFILIVVYIVVDATLVLKQNIRELLKKKCCHCICHLRIESLLILTAIEALLLLLGLGTWKFLPSRSALSSSSLELELSSGLIP